MRISLMLSALLIGTSLFVGCGGSSGGSGSGGLSGNDGSGGGVNNHGSWVPVTDNFTCDPEPLSLNGMTIDTRYAADGNISVSCVSVGNITVGKYSLDVDTLSITQLIKVARYEGTAAQGTFFGTETHDYAAGTIHRVENGPGENLNCVETYATLLPKTINSIEDIEDLMDFTPSREMLTETTCPASYYADNDGDGSNDPVGSGNGIERINYTFTDSIGNIHLIATETKGSY